MRSRSTWYALQLGPSKRHEGKKLFELPFAWTKKRVAPHRGHALPDRAALERIASSCTRLPDGALEELFPGLAENVYRVTNPRDNDCNCIA